jgi:O-antigen ligase
MDSGNWLCTIVATTIPLALGIYWVIYSAIGADIISMALRVFVTGAVALLAVFWFDIPVTQGEARFTALLANFLVLLIVPSLMATDPIRAFRDLAKLMLMSFIGLGLARALRDRGTARMFGFAMLAGSAILTAFVLYVYAGHIGFSLPSYAELRQMKGILASKEDLSLNAIGFSAMFMYVLGLCLVRAGRWIWTLGFVVFAVAALLTGSRAPAIIVVISAIGLLVMHLTRAHSSYSRITGWFIAIALTLSVIGSASILSSREIVSLTEGRSALWGIAWDKFTERPLVGFGLESWRDDISRIPGEFSVSSGSGQIAGAYHNEFMTLLAEGGLVALLPALAIAFWLLACSHWVAFESSVPAINGYMILFGCLFLLLRSAVEVPGLFGYAQEPADYLAYIFLAVVISQLSFHEDVSRMALRSRSSIAYSRVGLRVSN